MIVGKRVAAAADHLRRLGVETPRRAVVLERWMSGFSNELSGLTVVPARGIPGFAEPRRGEPGGNLLFGRLGGVPTVVVETMPHLCEGYLPGECGITVRALAALGAGAIVLVAAGSSLLEGTSPGSLFLVTDRIDLTGVAMLKGVPGPPGGGGIEVAPAPPALLRVAQASGAAAGVAVTGGVAALVHGPLRPTPAERRMLRTLGADAVSMGLAPELAAAAHAGVRAAAFLLLDGAWGRPHLDFCAGFLEAFAAAPPPGDLLAAPAGLGL